MVTRRNTTKVLVMEEKERKIEAALRTAIQKGIDSGICENFDPEEHLKQLKTAYYNGQFTSSRTIRNECLI